MIIVTGRTFDQRDLLMRFGGRWNNADRQWQFDRLTDTQIATLRGTVGLMVIEQPKPEPISFGVDDQDDGSEPLTALIARLLGQSRTRREGLRPSAIYGDDPTYHNHFADRNASAYFGFSSLDAFASYIHNLPPSITRDPARSGWEIDDGDWRGTRSMPDALAIARDGWRDGLERAADVVEQLSLANPRVRRRKPSLAGGTVSVGRMLAGDPAHMIRRPKAPGRKVVTFFVEAGCNSYIDADSLIDRAALIGAMVDLMENVGYSCAVVAVDTSIEDQRPIYQLAVKLKEAGERLNLADMIFALGHPSFLRRFSFGACSSVNQTRRIWASQGSPSNAFDDDHPCRDNEFYVPVLNKNGTGDPFDLLPFVIPDKLPIIIERNDQ